jgi:predicted flap endonuclease-1-like 5' DNA nuclease
VANPLSAEDTAARATSAAATDLGAIDNAPASTAAASATGSDWVLEPPTSLQQGAASAAPYKLELPEAVAPAAAGTPGVTVEDLVQAANAEKMAQDAVKAAEVAARERAVDVSVGDDLTRITGLGKSSERKLKGAGIITFAQLAAVPAEIIATILGVPVEEVIEDEIGKQAHALAGS